MPPKTKATPEQVAADLKENNINPVAKLRRKVKHPGVNKNIGLTTKPPTIEQIWPKDV